MDDAFLFGGINPLEAVLARSARRGRVTHVELHVAYVSRSGLEEIRKLLRSAGIGSSKVRFLCSADPFASDLGALHEVGKREGWEVKWHPDPERGRFHPKVYVAYTVAKVATVFVGSHNATHSAYSSNVEAGRVVSLPTASSDFRELFNHLQRCWADGEEITAEHAERCRVARQLGLGTIAVAASAMALRGSPFIARELMRHAMARSGGTPCLDSLGEHERALDLALAFDYLRSVAAIDVPLSTCLEIVRRANLPPQHYLKVPADLHRAFQQVGAVARREIRPVVEPLETWPTPLAPTSVPSRGVVTRLRWLLDDPQRSPLFHSRPRGAAPEWAYTFDFLHTISGIDVPWEVARDVVRRSGLRGASGIVQPDTIRHEFRNLPEFRDLKREKGWLR